MATKKFAYSGNPGMRFTFESGAVVLNPGDVVELTDAEVAAVGPDEFKPTKSKAAAQAPAADPAPVAADPEGDPS